jgi:hypothetical protein
VAPGPNGFLAIHDLHTQNAQGQFGHRLFATRIASNGTVLDPQGRLIGVSTYSNNVLDSVAAERVGTHWLVAFHSGNNEISVVTVADDGTAGTPTIVSSTETPGDLAWGGDRALLTTLKGGGYFLSANGTPMGSRFQISSSQPPGVFQLGGGHAAFDGTRFLVSYASPNTINPTTVTAYSVTTAGATGQSAVVNSVPAGRITTPVDVVTSGSTFLLTYMTQASSSSPSRPEYKVATVDSPGAITLGSAQALDSQFDNGVFSAFAGGRYLLWYRHRTFELDAAGASLGPAQSLLTAVSTAFFNATGSSGFSMKPSLDGSSYLAYEANRASRVTGALAPQDVPPLAPLSLPTPQKHPALAFNGQDYFSAWVEEGVGTLGARVTGVGIVLDAPAFPIAPNHLRRPLAVSNGADVLASTSTIGALSSLFRISQTGMVANVSASLPAEAFTASLASNNSDYFVEWAEPDPNTFADSFAATVSGTFLSVPVQHASSLGNPTSVAFDGQNYVVVWSRFVGGNTRELQAIRVTPGLSPLDATPKTILSYPSPPPDLDLGPRIASSGQDSLVAWSQGDPNANTATIHVARINRNLDLQNPGAVTVGNGEYPGRGLSLAWDGTRYWLLWHDIRTLYGRRIAADASPFDAQPFVVSDDLPLDYNSVPALARGASGQLMVAYQQFDDVANRLRARFLSTAAGGSGGGGAGGQAGGGAGGVSAGAGGAPAGAGGGPAGFGGGPSGGSGAGGGGAGPSGGSGAGGGGAGPSGGSGAGGGGAGPSGGSGAGGGGAGPSGGSRAGGVPSSGAGPGGSGAGGAPSSGAGPGGSGAGGAPSSGAGPGGGPSGGAGGAPAGAGGQSGGSGAAGAASGAGGQSGASGVGGAASGAGGQAGTPGGGAAGASNAGSGGAGVSGGSGGAAGSAGGPSGGMAGEDAGGAGGESPGGAGGEAAGGEGGEATGGTGGGGRAGGGRGGAAGSATGGTAGMGPGGAETGGADDGGSAGGGSSDDEGGCDCSTRGSRRDGPPITAALIALGLVARRRRRRETSASQATRVCGRKGGRCR